MSDETSSSAEDTSVRSASQEAATDPTPNDFGDAVLIPLRPARRHEPTRARRPRALSPLWSEVASVLARARVPAADEPDATAA